ncbi:MAG TPA: M24 family metallopeptidase [Actinomycetota bacterium]|nr:M24 family metallopeptidase [Actinomycetota bacterium]
MTTFLLYDDALRSPEMRHEIGEPIMDPLVFLEHDGKRLIVGSDFEKPIFEKREDVVDEFWNIHDLGFEELMRDRSLPEHLIGPELLRRALERLGAVKAVVPGSFQVLVADYLRDRGIELVVDEEAWSFRRRRKTPWEIEGIERAQRAAETAMLTGARMLREAAPTPTGTLRFEGEILTAEMIREAMVAELLSQGCDSEDILVHSGDACLAGHDPGTGPILPNASCIIDCFPRDRRTGTFADMTRTFVPGTPSEELKKLHAHCRAALDIALNAIRPGENGVHGRVVEYFHEQGLPTREHHDGPGALREGFTHSLGHGVGLQVHEKPWVGRRPDPLEEGDVIAIEPGLYFRGVGGVRLEDTVLVTAEGAEFFTEPYPYDLAP